MSTSEAKTEKVRTTLDWESNGSLRCFFRHGTEIFAYGSNSHYNLGLDQGQGTVPKCVDFFKRNGISVTSIAMSSFHSLFLSSNNELYAVGHGFGGRLGHGSESTAVQPQRLNLRFKRTDEKIISLSASKNHSLILTNLGNVRDDCILSRIYH